MNVKNSGLFRYLFNSFGEEVEEVGRGAQAKGEDAVEIVSALPLHA